VQKLLSSPTVFGDLVNSEVDLLIRLVERRLGGEEFGTSSNASIRKPVRRVEVTEVTPEPVEELTMNL
jgi:hypothetical protein